MNFIENEITLTKSSAKLLKVKIIEQKKTINTLKKQIVGYQKTIRELKNTIQKKEKNDKKINQELQLKIKRLIDEKLYLQKDISLNVLAEKMKTNRTYLSRFIIEEYSSFYNFLNIYRIEEACLILKNEKNIILKRIYSHVGYKSQNTFYRAFKKIKKVTPGEYFLA